MRSLICVLALAVTISLVDQHVVAEERPVADSQRFEKLKTTLKKKVETQYLLFLPDGYEKKGDKKWPMIFFLHGAGERGDDLNKVAIHGPPKIVQSRKDFPFVVVSPQCPTGQFWSNDVLLALLDHVVDEHAIDEDRIYLTGLSMGGYGTWSLASTAPDRFAAIAPICGGGSRIMGWALGDMPTWVFHGAKDPVVPLDEAERMVELLKRMNNPVKYTVYPEAGHDSWTETYDNEELYKWFLEHRREER
jgi:predicted peptidase|tara:strand:+ start:4170 stop:4913 length:744 start_codon:yes stop_codon:yes gene_type:complete